MKLEELRDSINELIRERDALQLEVLSLKLMSTTPNNRKKLTAREAGEIRRLARTTGMTNKEVADIYDVNPATVSRIKRGIYHAAS
ncbi:helix-turn-helix domain-containing protein [Nocardia sp. NPDC055002]